MTSAAFLSVALLAGLSTLPAAAHAQAGGQTSCLTEREVQAVTTWLLPEGIDGLARRCRAALPPRSFLATSGAALADRYRGESSDEAATARRALTRVAGDLPLSLLGDDVPGALIVAGAVQQMDAQDCAKADRLVSLLSPLPRASIGEVAAMLIAAALRNTNASDLPIRICRPAR
jgi:hypothetical protein